MGWKIEKPLAALIKFSFKKKEEAAWSAANTLKQAASRFDHLNEKSAEDTQTENISRISGSFIAPHFPAFRPVYI